MKKARKCVRDPDMQPEYNFSGGVRGKYAKRYAAGTNLVLLDADVARIFPDAETVNKTLRTIASLVRERSRKK